MSARRVLGPALLLLLAAVSACGSPTGTQVATAGGAAAGATATPSVDAADREERMRQFAACMREHGVDVPDPEPGSGGVRIGGGGAGPGRIRPDDPDFRAAFGACRSKLPNGGEPPKLNPEQIEQFRQFAACMREHGVDVPDPDADGRLRIGPGQDGGRLPREDPEFETAITACRDKLGGVLPGPGPSGAAS
jgi:hypothetical protein